MSIKQPGLVWVNVYEPWVEGKGSREKEGEREGERERGKERQNEEGERERKRERDGMKGKVQYFYMTGEQTWNSPRTKYFKRHTAHPHTSQQSCSKSRRSNAREH